MGPPLASPAPGSRPRCPVEIQGLGRGRAPGDLGAGPRWAWQGRGQVGRGRAWSRARELTSSVAAESIGAFGRPARAGGRAQGHPAAQIPSGVGRLTWTAAGGGPESTLCPIFRRGWGAGTQKPGPPPPPPRSLLSPPPPRSRRRPREATAGEETPRNKGTRRRRARGASGRAPSPPLPACRKVDGLQDETPRSRARPRPGARDPTPSASRALRDAWLSGPDPAPDSEVLRLPGADCGSGRDAGGICRRRGPSPTEPAGGGCNPALRAALDALPKRLSTP